MELLIFIPILILMFTLIGSAFGTLTGLIPGLHVNTVALLLITGYPLLYGVLVYLAGENGYHIPLCVAIMIVSTSITHTFVDFVPATFLGAPDDETALSVLPAHKLLLQGQGYRAVYLSAIGSAFAMIFAMILLIPYSWALGRPLNLYPLLKTSTIYILLFLTSLLLITEQTEIRGSKSLGVVFAFCVFLGAGILGIIVLELPSSSPIGLYSTVLFPLFSGLFGISTLFLSLIDHEEGQIPIQKIDTGSISHNTMHSAVPGTLTGSIVGFLPGVSSAHAALIALIPSKGDGKNETERVIVTLGAVNTSNAIFVLIALFLTGNPRSGAAVAIQGFLPLDTWTGTLPYFLVLILISVIISSFLAFHITLIAGKCAAKYISKIPYHTIIRCIITFIILLVIIFNGILGLAILLISTLFGMLPPLFGVRRSHLMGVLLIPVILYLW